MKRLERHPSNVLEVVRKHLRRTDEEQQTQANHYPYMLRLDLSQRPEINMQIFEV